MTARRVLKVAEAIRETVSLAILTELRDPRVQDVTVTFVEVSADLRHAKVHISVMGDERKESLVLHGLDAAAGWLNQQPNANHLSVAAWYGDGPLSYFLQSEQPILSLWSPEFWFDADYVVFYINQWQRKIPSSEVIDYFANQTPAHVVRANGLELVRIYAVNKTSPPEFTNLSVERCLMA